MANFLTISRILLIFPVLILASPESSTANWVALLIFVVAGITDHLDGYLARKTNTTSSLGALLDLLADKLLVSINPCFHAKPREMAQLHNKRLNKQQSLLIKLGH